MELIKAPAPASQRFTYPARQPAGDRRLTGGQIQLRVACHRAGHGAAGESRQLRAIAVARAATRWPRVPGLAEAGVPGVLLDIWNAAAALRRHLHQRTPSCWPSITSIARTRPDAGHPVSARLAGRRDGARGLAQRMKTDAHRRAGPSSPAKASGSGRRPLPRLTARSDRPAGRNNRLRWMSEAEGLAEPARRNSCATTQMRNETDVERLADTR